MLGPTARLNDALPEADLVVRSALLGRPVMGPPYGPTEDALALRFADSAGGVGGAAMVPIYVGSSLLGMLEPRLSRKPKRDATFERKLAEALSRFGPRRAVWGRGVAWVGAGSRHRDGTTDFELDASYGSRARRPAGTRRGLFSESNAKSRCKRSGREWRHVDWRPPGSCLASPLYGAVSAGFEGAALPAFVRRGSLEFRALPRLSTTDVADVLQIARAAAVSGLSCGPRGAPQPRRAMEPAFAARS